MLARRAPLSHRFTRPAPGVADRSPKSADARLAVMIDTGTLADAAQVGVVLVDLQTGRAVAQHAERVATDKAPTADARGLRAAFGNRSSTTSTATAARIRSPGPGCAPC